MQLSVIIVNYNVKHYLYQCLVSLRRATAGLEWEVFVVDNNSSDNSIQYLHTAFEHDDFPQLQIIANKENYGFGKANNQAFLQAKGNYVLYVNPDTFIGEQTIKDCLEFMSTHPDAGCLGVKMLNADGSFAPESRRGIPTPWASFCKITRLGKIFPKSRVFGRYYLQHLPIDQVAKVQIISGAFMMVKRDVATQVGIFDEDFFMYCEDTDLAYRMQKAGYNNYYLPTTILHYKGESTRRNTYSYVNNFYKAIFIFFKKHYNAHIAILRILFYIAIYILAAASFLKKMFIRARYRIKSTLTPRQTRLLILSNAINDHLLNKFTSKYDLITQTLHKKINHADELLKYIGNFKPDYIVYDTTLYSYEEILNIASSLPATKRCTIGTLYPQNAMILTNLYIFTL